VRGLWSGAPADLRPSSQSPDYYTPSKKAITVGHFHNETPPPYSSYWNPEALPPCHGITALSCRLLDGHARYSSSSSQDSALNYPYCPAGDVPPILQDDCGASRTCSSRRAAAITKRPARPGNTIQDACNSLSVSDFCVLSPTHSLEISSPERVRSRPPCWRLRWQKHTAGTDKDKIQSNSLPCLGKWGERTRILPLAVTSY